MQPSPGLPGQKSLSPPGTGVSATVPSRQAFLPSAVALDERDLVGFGLPVDLFGVDDVAQQLLVLGEHVGEGGIARQVGRLLRVGVEVEQLGLEAELVVDNRRSPWPPRPTTQPQADERRRTVPSRPGSDPRCARGAGEIARRTT